MSCTVESVTDIEDFSPSVSREPDHGKSQVTANTVAFRRKRKDQESLADDADTVTLEADSTLPGRQKIWMKTFGCSHNVSDSEYMQGILDAQGYVFVEDSEAADLWLVNSCTVKDPSQSAFVHIVTRAKESNTPLVIAGCVPQADRQLKGLEGCSIVGIQQIDRVVEIVEETLKGNTVRLLSKSTLPRLDLPKIRKNPLVEIIPLSTGCLGSCTYCKTKHARGQLGSYDPRAIVSRVQQVCAEGVAEVWLSSEDTGAYGRDIGTSLPQLLRSCIDALPEGVMLRVGMTNPPFILDSLSEIAECLRHPQVFSFLHIPVQSGSDAVLSAMRREYTIAEFKRVCDFMLAEVPGITLATDIICGFPTESEADFEETMQLVQEYKFAILNISQFYPRPGTPAAKMKQLGNGVKKQRSRRLTTLFESFQPYEHLIGQECDVWVANEVPDSGEHSVAHTKSYVKVLIPRDDELKGKRIRVQITSAHRFHVTADVLTRSPPALPACTLPGKRATDVVHTNDTSHASKSMAEAVTDETSEHSTAIKTSTETNELLSILHKYPSVIAAIVGFLAFLLSWLMLDSFL